MKRRILMIVCLIFAFMGVMAFVAGCTDENDTPAAESGEYYYDADGTEYLLTLAKGNKYTLVMGDDTSSGSYVLEGEALTLNPSEGDPMLASYAGTSISLPYGDVTYKFLKKVNFTVKFETDGGTKLPDVSVLNGKTIEAPADPAKDGSAFIGWYTDASHRTEFYFSQPITADTTLYAYFVAKLDPEYTVKFDLNYEGAEEADAPAPQETAGRKLYRLPEPVREDGVKFVGWYVSQFASASKLTYEYTDQVLAENTTLYAVWDENGAPVVSLSESGVAIRASGANNNFTISITAPDAEEPTTGRQSGNGTYAYDFAGGAGGEYKVEVTLNGRTTTRYYNNKALARVSVFTVEESTLLFNSVENAEHYYLTVVCGTEGHVHNEIDLNTETSWSFAACDMRAGGILFTVKATAEGYISSTSETFTFTRTLDAVENVAYDAETGNITWDAVEKATGYVVKVTKGGEELFNENIGNALTFDFKSYGTGEYTVSVQPVARGWILPEASEFTCTKSRLATPSNLRFSGTGIVWDPVEGNKGYEIDFDGRIYDAVGTSFDFADLVEGKTEFKLSVRAKGTDEATSSLWSDPLSVTNQMGEVRYGGGKVTWDPVIGVETYRVVLNGGEPIEVTDGKNSCAITFDKKGTNTIGVMAVYKNGSTSELKTTEVEVYELVFESEGGDTLASLFVADGDPISLPTWIKKYGYKFGGWYTAPNGGDGEGLPYEDRYFDGNSDRSIYAAWIPNDITVTFNLGRYGDAESFKATSVVVKFGEPFELPVPGCLDATRVFEAWRLDSDVGIQITDFKGQSTQPFLSDADVTVYASYQMLFAFEEVENGYRVNKGPAIGYISEVTIPAYVSIDNGERKPVVDLGDFSNCTTLVRLSIPDTVTNINFGLTGICFTGCTKLQWCEVYEVEENTAEKVFSSANGVLLRKNSATGELELRYVPYGMTGVLDVPDGVTAIVEGAYYVKSTYSSGGDTSGGITQVNIPSSVTRIARGAFSFSSSLREIYFEPDGDKDVQPLTIDPMMVSNNYKYELYYEQGTYISNGSYLSKITLPKRIETTFTAETLMLFRSLAEIEIEEGGKLSVQNGLVIRDNGAEGKEVVFAAPRGEGVKDVTIPSGVFKIGEKAFFYNTTVRNIVIPEWVTEIGARAFEGCYLADTLKFEGTETSNPLKVGENAFYLFYYRRSKPESGSSSSPEMSLNNKVTELILPANLYSMGNRSFGSMLKLKEVTVNAALDKVEYGEGAFNNNADNAYVETVNLGAKCPMFDVPGVFGRAVKKVVVDEANPNYSTDDQGVLFAKDQASGKRSIAFFPTAFEGDYTLPEDVTEIPASCFTSRNSLTGITLHSKVSKIGDQAFYDCKLLAKVIFLPTPEGQDPVELTIGASAFFRCVQLKELSLPERVKTLGASVFKDCSALTELVLPASLEKIEAKTTGSPIGAIDVFDGCDSLSKLTVAEGSKHFTTVGGVLYELKAVYKEGSSKESENPEFDYVPYTLLYCPVGVSGTVTVPGSVHVVEKYAFNYSDKVEKIVFEKTKEYRAPGEPTEEEPDPADVTIPAEIEILENAFYHCGGLTEVTFGQGLKTMRTNMFYSCLKLATVTISNTVTTIQPNTFYVDSSSSSALALAHILFEDGGNDPLRIEDGTQTTSGSGPVDTYYHGAFGNLDKLEAIEFPSRLAYLGNNAFRMDSPGRSTGKSSHLASVKFKALKEGMTLEIGTYVFYGAPISELVLPEGLKKVGNYAFYSISARDNAGSVTLPSTLEEIGNNAFYYIHFADELVIPASVRTIGKEAFAQNATRATATTKITFADNSQLESIGNSAFSNFVNVTSFQFSKNANAQGEVAAAAETENRALFTLGASVFSGMKNLQSIELPANLTSIADSAFSGLTGLTSITWESPENSAITSIGASAFSRTGISKFAFPKNPDSPISLGANLFMFCGKLATVSLSASINDINNVFTGCSALQTIEIAEDNTYLSSKPPIIYNAAGNVVKYVCGAYNKDEGIFQIPEGGTEIGGGAFNGQTEIVEIRIPASVQKIGDNAFANCVSLKKVVFANGSVLTEIGKAAFLNCVSLESINLEVCDRLEKLGEGTSSNGGVFAGCKNLKSLKFGKGIKTLGAYQFDDYSFVEEVDLSACLELQELQNYLFQDNVSIKSVKLPSSLTHVGSYTFDGCTNLSRVNSDEEGTVDLSGLVNLQYMYGSKPGSSFKPETSSGSCYTFQDCTSIKKAILPPNLDLLGGSAFKNCTNLTEVVGLENVLNLAGSSIFQNTGLTSVTIGERTKSLGTSLFQGCERLSSLTFENPENFTSLPGSLVRDCPRITSFNLAQFTKVTTLNTYMLSGTGITKADLSSFKTIKSLPNYMFLNCTRLTEVILPTTEDGAALNYLGTNTFQGCTRLSKINSEEEGTFDLSGINLSGIGTSATVTSNTGTPYTFDGCQAVKKVILPEKCTKLTGYVFQNCTSLAEINLEKVTTIGKYCFLNTAFTSLVIPKTVTSWGEGAFKGCEKLTRVQLASGFTSLGSKWIFAECPKLAEVIVPTTVTHLGTYTFQNDEKLTRIVTSDKTGTELEIEIMMVSFGTFDLSKATKLTRLSSGASQNVTSATSYDSYVFAGCLGLRQFKAASTFAQISGYAFDGCSNLTRFNSDEEGMADLSNITNIGRYAFRGTGITSVTLGSKLTTNVFYAPFQDCENLTSMTLEGTNANVKVENGMLINAKTNAVIMAIPNLTITSDDGTLKFTDELALSSYAFQGSLHGVNTLDLSALTITSIPTYAFADAGFKKIVLPATVTSIGTYAFSNSALESIDFNGAKVTSIGEYAFQGTALTEFTVPNTVTSLGYGTFYNCKQLQTVTFEDGAPEGAEETLVTIGEGSSSAPKNDGSSEKRGVFEDSGVRKVIFHRVAKLPVRGFANAKSLTTIEFGDEMTEIGGYYTFYGCDSYTSIEIPATVTTIGAYAFAYSCFTEVTIPGTVTSMSSYTFGYSKVVTVTFKDGDPEATLPTTMYNTFRECKDLKNVDLGNRFTVLAYDFFTGCTSLEKLVIPEGVTQINGICLGCTSLTSISLPESLTTIGDTRNNFENTPLLKNIEIPAGVSSINAKAFVGMTKEQTVTFKSTRFGLVQAMNSALFIANSDANFVFEPLE